MMQTEDDDDYLNDDLAFWYGLKHGFLILAGACAVAWFIAWLAGWVSIVS